MPELPDVEIYREALSERILGRTLERIRIASPFLLRTISPPLSSAEGHTVRQIRRVGKRIAIEMDNSVWMALHLMIAGRLHWQARGKPVSKMALAAFEFENGTLTLTEAGSRKRASLHMTEGEEGIRALDPGGLEVLEADLPAFVARLRSTNHTLKRSLTDPRLFSGIGNAYSDEILHRAMLSPAALSQKIGDTEAKRLYEAVQNTLRECVERLRNEAKGAFPEKVTAFRTEMAVHGKYGQPCPRCGAPVQRIRYADNETNYCVRCQTGGKLLADRSLSRLLREDWPRSLEELEALPARAGRG